MQNAHTGTLVISLDFELYWGMTDKLTLQQYGKHIVGVHTVVPKILTLFEDYDIHATWATVGLVMCRNRNEQKTFSPPPADQPRYTDPVLSNYRYGEKATIGENETDDPYHFGSSLIEKILRTPNQELASHTFSHLYCRLLENLEEAFRADCAAQQHIATTYNTNMQSIVFPRNQITDEALTICAKHGFKSYRGNEDHLLYRDGTEQSLPIRALKLLDSYLNISGQHTRQAEIINGIVNVPSSRFLRPYNKTLAILEPMKIKRITDAMTHAAKNGSIFHLWWHPHNFGVDQAENLAGLETILKHFKQLKEHYDMKSATMAEVATSLRPSSESSCAVI